MATELRVRTVIEMMGFLDSYMSEYAAVDLDGVCGVTYMDTIHEIAVDGGCASVWALAGLASVIKRPIVSVYPTTINGNVDVVAATVDRTF